MNIRWNNGMLLIQDIKVDAKLTLIDSAQSFVWREHQGKFYAVVFDAAVSVEQLEGGLLIYPVSEDAIDDYIHYFDLIRDYSALKVEYVLFDKIVQSLEMLPGLKRLNQPVWDTLLGYILSANNNVQRIRKLTWLLSEHFGELRELDGLTMHTLPSWEVLSEVNEAELRKLGFGYRAPYLIGTARMVRDDPSMLDRLSEMPYEEAHRVLIGLPGVGDKVADCVLLSSCGHGSAFPVDVWVERLLVSWFPELQREKSPKKALRGKARALLGENAGIVQLFLFHCARAGLIQLEDARDASV